jgi:glycosyltransferase involved in cell wall biosynthesis
VRILLLTPEYLGFGGGIMTFYQALAPALRESGVDLRVIEGSAFHAANDRAIQVIDGISVETLERDRLSRWWNRFPALAALPVLRRHLAAAWAMWEQAECGADVDVIEATDWGFLFVPPAIESTRPLVVQCHGSIGQIADHDPIAGEESDNLFARLIEKNIFSIVGTIQTYSRANAEFWRAETARQLTVIPPAWIRPVIVDQQESTDRALVVGRLQRWKGPIVLCETLRRLGRGAPCVDWTGRDTAWGARGGSTAQHLAQTYPDVWKTKFFYHLPTSPAEVARRQARALLNIVPSTWDMFNFTTVEAMASGRPTIVSTGAGSSELIEDGVNGYLFANESTDELASAIERVLGEKPTRLAEIGRQARDTICAALNPTAIVAQRMTAYRATIKAFSTRQPAPVGGWLGAACRPSEMFGNDMAFLENLPLRMVGKHVVSRIYRRVRNR